MLRRLFTRAGAGIARACGLPVRMARHRRARLLLLPLLLAGAGGLALAGPRLLERFHLQRELARAAGLVRAGRRAEAETALRELARRRPGASAPRVNLAKLLLLRADADGALAELYAGLQAEPDAPHLRCAMAGLLMDTGQSLAAADFAEQELRRAPRCSVARMLLGQYYLTLFQNGLAVRELEAAAKEDPDSGPVQVFLARAYRGSSLFDQAERAARRAVELDPQQPHCHVELALALLESPDRGRLFQAFDAAQRAAQIDPDLIPARFALGKAYQKLGRPADAAREMEAALRGSPRGHYEIHYALSQVYTALGRKEEARRQLAAFEAANRVKRRFSDFQWKLSRAPRDPDLLWEYGRLLEEVGRPVDAVGAYRRAVTAEPRHRRSHAALGRLFTRARRFEEASRHLRAAEALAGAEPAGGQRDAEGQQGTPDPAAPGRKDPGG